MLLNMLSQSSFSGRYRGGGGCAGGGGGGPIFFYNFVVTDVFVNIYNIQYSLTKYGFWCASEVI